MSQAFDKLKSDLGDDTGLAKHRRIVSHLETQTALTDGEIVTYLGELQTYLGLERKECTPLKNDIIEIRKATRRDAKKRKKEYKKKMEDVEAEAKEKASKEAEKEAAIPRTSEYLPDGHVIPHSFDIINNTTIFYKQIKNGGFEKVEVCDGAVSVVGAGTNHDDGNYYLDIEFMTSHSGRTHIILPKEAGLSRRGVMTLVQKGLTMDEASAGMLNKYIATYITENKEKIETKIMTNRNGWKDDGLFVCGTKGITESQIIEVTPTDTDVSTHMTTSGTFEGWCESVKDIMKFEPTRLKMYVAHTAPLLKWLQVGNFVLDNHALSGQLKTVTCDVATSAAGNPAGLQQSANMTLTAAERKLILANDCCTFFDETSNAQQEFLEQLVYMAGNGRQRGRGTKEGSLVHEETFRGVILTTGEKPIIADSSKGGVDARLIEYNIGIYEKYNKAEAVKNGIAMNFGHMIERYIQYIIPRKNDIIRRHDEIATQYTGELGKDVRKARQYAAIAVSGEIVDLLLRDYIKHETAPVDLMRSILDHTTKQQNNLEYHERALYAFSDWVTCNESSFVQKEIVEEGAKDTFGNVATQPRPQRDIAGYQDENHIYVPPTKFNEIMNEINYSAGAIREPWIKLGLSPAGSKNGKQIMQMQTKPKIGDRQKWMVTINKRVMDVLLGQWTDENR